MVVVRDARPADAGAIAAIYNYYVVETVATFEEIPVSAETVRSRIADVRSYSLPWLVACNGDALVGFAYAARWRERSAYRHSVETTVYVKASATGRGIGEALYRELFAGLSRSDVHAAVAGITLPNPASVRLHEKFGFDKVAEFPEIGRKFDRWLAVGYWQKLLNDT